MSVSAPLNLKFSVDSQLMEELGQRVVTRNHVALAELVKNAYDADANKVTITFKDEKNIDGIRESAIVLTDDGTGMPYGEVKERWMRIATNNKVENPVSLVYGRPKTGNKGIGRLSCQRLSRQLILITCAKVGASYEKTTVYFDWKKFVPGTTLTDIPCRYIKQRYKKAETGTTLKLIGLRDEWTQRDFDTLRRAIIDLTLIQEAKRRGYQPDKGFSIETDAPGFENASGDLFEQISDAGWGRLRGKVKADGRLYLQLKGKHLGQIKRFKSEPKYKKFKGLELDIARFSYSKSSDLNRNKKVLAKSLLQKVTEQSGVRVYYEGFRIFPLGEQGNDWLGLDRDYAVRTVGSKYPVIESIRESMNLVPRDVGLSAARNENLLGRVMFRREHSTKLEIPLNREGFIETSVYQEFKALVRLAVEWMGVYYAYARKKSEDDKNRKSIETFKESISKDKNYSSKPDAPVVAEAIKYLGEKAQKAVSRSEEEPASYAIEAATELLKANYQQQVTEIEMLRALASTAPLLFTFSHEIHWLIGKLYTNSATLRNIKDSIPDKKDQQEIENMASELEGTADRFTQLSVLFGVLSQAKSSGPKRHYVLNLIKDIIKGTQFTTENSGIEVSYHCDKDLKSPKIRKAELLSLLINVYTNALKSCIAKGRGKVKIIAKATNRHFIIEVLDTGVGLPKKYWEEVLTPFVSDPANNIYSKLESRIGDTTIASLGRGSGLGLSIVKGILTSYNGKFEFYNLEGWAIGVRLSLNKE